MPMYRVRAYRRQLVEVIVEGQDDEWAFDNALDINKHEWDVVETFDIEDCDSVTYIDPSEFYEPVEE